MTDDDHTSDNASGGGPSLEGYFYQVDVSVWAALDLLLAKKLAQQLVLEPASKEDLEATLAENEPGRLNATVGTLIMAAGPGLFGLAHDLSGSYAASLCLCIGLQLASAIIILRAPRVIREPVAAVGG
jgi:hypothetical protein